MPVHVAGLRGLEAAIEMWGATVWTMVVDSGGGKKVKKEIRCSPASAQMRRKTSYSSSLRKLTQLQKAKGELQADFKEALLTSSKYHTFKASAC